MSSTEECAVSCRLVASISLNSTTSPGAMVIAGGQALSHAGRCWSRWIVWLRPFTWTVSFIGALLCRACEIPTGVAAGPLDLEKYGFSQLGPARKGLSISRPGVARALEHDHFHRRGRGCLHVKGEGLGIEDHAEAVDGDSARGIANA